MVLKILVKRFKMTLKEKCRITLKHLPKALKMKNDVIRFN